MKSWTERLVPLGNAFHRYARWLVGISWGRFFLLALLVLIGAAILGNLPPFGATRVEHAVRVTSDAPRPPARPPAPPPLPPTPPPAPPTAATNPPHPDAPSAVPASPAAAKSAPEGPHSSVKIIVQPQDHNAVEVTISGSAALAEILNEAMREVQQALEPPTESTQGRGGAQRLEQRVQIRIGPEGVIKGKKRGGDTDNDDNAQEVAQEAAQDLTNHVRIHQIDEDFPAQLALLWIVASIIIKITYSGKLRAEAQASLAAAAAETEQLRRQVAEARLAAMQAQMEPHFLFNTLASIDHLIQTDPPKASRMQKSLIALLRATLANLRDPNSVSQHTLGQEIDVIRPYLEIQKVRMEERLDPRIEVPAGLYSAEFPPLMLQALVENAIKHGLEPRPEGGQLSVRSEIRDGKLLVSVSDTGVGLHSLSSAGVGLSNIRERLQLIYGPDAVLNLTPLAPHGTLATLSLPYRHRNEAHRADAMGANRPPGNG